MGDRMGAVMGFNRASINRLRALGAACVTAAVIAAYWAAWAALVLALAGLLAGVVVPFCLGRSWRGVLGSIALRRLGLAHPNTDSSSVKEGGETERLLSRERGPWTVPFERPAGGAQAPPEAAVLRARSFHTWSLKTRPRDASSEACVRPQNGVRLAAESFSEASAPGKPACPDEAGEVIDFQSVLGNLEKRYRGPHPAGRSHVPEPPSDEGPPVTMDMEEIRRRLRAAYGGRLPGAARQSTSEPRGEVPPRGFTGAREERIGPLASRPATINPSSRGHSETAWEDLRRLRRTGKPEVKLKATGDGAPRTPQESPWGRSMERPTPPATARPLPSSAIPPGRALLAESSRTATMGAPDEATGATLLDRQPDVGEMEPPFSPTHPCKVIVKGGELQCLPLAPEHGVREWSPALPPRTATQVLPSSMGNPVEPSPAAPPAPYVADSQVNSSRPDPCDGPCLPPLSLLHPADSAVAPMSQDDLIEGGILIEEKLAEFRVKVSVQDAYAGPVITRYEVQPAVGVRGGQVVSLMKDLARALGMASIRVVETIPGKTCMGLELPNSRRQMIRLSEVLSSEVFQSQTSKLALVLGKDIVGDPVIADLAKAPHILVAGTTGSGKSVGVNAMILSLLYRATPDEVRLVMIDPKMLELSIYDGIPHLLAPVVTDMKLAANALTWCVGEMERRYRLMSGLQVRSLAGYNQKVREAIDAGEPLLDLSYSTQDNPIPLAPLPYIVVVVDELADLMMVAGKKIEELIARLAQKARAAGIHLIIATQRPSVDVITGLIKANIPTRIAFQVSSKVDSRTILDQMGAECLLGQGDMLYLPAGTGYPQRVHGAFVADEEVQAVAEHLKQLGEPHYVEGVLGGAADGDEGGAETERFIDENDPLYEDAVSFVISSRRASISAVQRQLRIGYNRAARLVEQMEASGLVSPMESNGNRTVLVPVREE